MEAPQSIGSAPFELQRREPIGVAGTQVAPLSADVHCELSESTHAFADLVELDPDTEEVLGPLAVTPTDHWIAFRPRNALGLGWLRTHRHQPVPIGWAEGACLGVVELEPLPIAIVRGHVEGAAGTDAFVVSDCGMSLAPRVDDNGDFELELPFDPDVTGRCPFYAMRVFGMRNLVSEAVVVQPSVERPTTIALDLPPAPPAGWALYESGSRVRIIELDPGSPAVEAGLTLGEFIVSVDGAPVGGWEVGELEGLEPPFSVTVDGEEGVRTEAIQ